MGINSDYLIYCSGALSLIGILALLLFLTRRSFKLLKTVSSTGKESSRLTHTLGKFILMIVWISAFGMVMFIGFFLRTYYTFSLELPVAEVYIQQTDTLRVHHIVLDQYVSPDSQRTQSFIIKGDQWMLEGDILKWDNWLNFLGLHTRYRLTRIRGRYVRTEDESREKPTVYSLVPEEDHPFWQYLYKFGQKLPFVSTVYGNAVFQVSGVGKKYQVYVSTSGFVAREKM